MSAILSRAIVRSDELERSSDSASASFFRQLGKDLLKLRGTANAKARLECSFRACTFLWRYGETQDAIAFAHHAITLATSTNRLNDLRRTHLVLGALYADSGNYSLALDSYVNSLEIASTLNDGKGVFVVWNNLSALFVDSGLLGEALSCATQSLRVADRYELSDSELCRCVQNNIVLARYRLGDYSGALTAARRVALNAPEPRTAAEAGGRVIREEHLIFALVANGEFREAKARAQYVNELVTRFPAPRQQLIAATVNGLCEVLLGDPRRGLEMLEQAVSVAQYRQSAFYPDALSALAKAYDETGDCERALEATRRLINHLEAIHLDTSIANLSTIRDPFEAPHHAFSSNKTELKRAEAELHSKVLQRELARSRQEMLERMAVAADIREDISGEHGYRVGRLSALLAKEIGWDRDACNALDIAARLHDIGKIGIPEKILLDEKTLREAERHFIASHTLVGAEILAKSDIPQVRIAEEIARCHHERWDGTGYPRQLAETAIPKSARIVALADVFDAMTHGRPYARAIPIDEALDLIASLRGRQFDPELTDHFLALVRRLAASNTDLDGYLGKAARNSPFLKARARIKELLAQGRDSTALSVSPPPPGTRPN
jgi:putative two-component system response regulator